MSRIINSDILLKWMKQAVPQLNFTRHKGQTGKICVIGGSKEYTGAPYFSAISALYCGADLVHVICPAEAASIIKSYSPELIVHPILNTNYEECCQWLKKMHAVVIGPGLGRENIDIPLKLIQFIRQCDIPLVIDADAIHLVAAQPNCVKGYSKTIITPNIVESRLLHDKILNNSTSPSNDDFTMDMKSCINLAKILDNVTICMKGQNDLISNGLIQTQINTRGSPRRCGGQGDLLSGTMALLLSWCYSIGNQHLFTNEARQCETLSAAAGASTLTRLCSELAFNDCVSGRSMTTSLMLKKIDIAFSQLF